MQIKNWRGTVTEVFCRRGGVGDVRSGTKGAKSYLERLRQSYESEPLLHRSGQVSGFKALEPKGYRCQSP